MAQSNMNPDSPSYQTESNFDFTAWLSQQIDTTSEETKAAMQELSVAYRYASLRAGMATDFAEKLQELKSEDSGTSSAAGLERFCQEYRHDVEAILEELSNALSNIISHG